MPFTPDNQNQPELRNTNNSSSTRGHHHQVTLNCDLPRSSITRQISPNSSLLLMASAAAHKNGGGGDWTNTTTTLRHQALLSGMYSNIGSFLQGQGQDEDEEEDQNAPEACLQQEDESQEEEDEPQEGTAHDLDSSDSQYGLNESGGQGHQDLLELDVDSLLLDEDEMMMGHNSKRGGGGMCLKTMPSRYMSDLEWRICQSVNIYVFKNGVESRDPILVHIPPGMRKSMKHIMNVIQDRVKYPIGFAKTLFTMDGTKVVSPAELEQYSNYVVASNYEKAFKCVAYGRERSPLLILNKHSKHVSVIKDRNEDYEGWLMRRRAAGDDPYYGGYDYPDPGEEEVYEIPVPVYNSPGCGPIYPKYKRRSNGLYNSCSPAYNTQGMFGLQPHPLPHHHVQYSQHYHHPSYPHPPQGQGQGQFGSNVVLNGFTIARPPRLNNRKKSHLTPQLSLFGKRIQPQHAPNEDYWTRDPRVPPAHERLVGYARNRRMEEELRNSNHASYRNMRRDRIVPKVGAILAEKKFKFGRKPQIRLHETSTQTTDLDLEEGPKEPMMGQRPQIQKRQEKNSKVIVQGDKGQTQGPLIQKDKVNPTKIVNMTKNNVGSSGSSPAPRPNDSGLNPQTNLQKGPSTSSITGNNTSSINNNNNDLKSKNVSGKGQGDNGETRVISEPSMMALPLEPSSQPPLGELQPSLDHNPVPVSSVLDDLSDSESVADFSVHQHLVDASRLLLQQAEFILRQSSSKQRKRKFLQKTQGQGQGQWGHSHPPEHGHGRQHNNTSGSIFAPSADSSQLK